MGFHLPPTWAIVGSLLTGVASVGVYIAMNSGPLAGGDAALEPTPTSASSVPAWKASVATRIVLPEGAQPSGVAVDEQGITYVSSFSARQVFKITPDGQLTLLAGSGAEEVRDARGSEAGFVGPGGIAVDREGNVYVADSPAHRIRKIDPSGLVTTFAGGGEIGLGQGAFADGFGESARLNLPAGLAFDPEGSLVVADKDNHRIRRISPDGEVTTVAGSAAVGHADGSLKEAILAAPTGVAVGADGTIWFTDHGSNSLRRITPAGRVETVARTSPHEATTGPGTSGGVALAFPSAVTLLPTGEVLVADTQGHRLILLTPDGDLLKLVPAGPTTPGLAEGTEVDAKFSSPVGLALDLSGHVIVSDRGNGRLRTLQLDRP